MDSKEIDSQWDRDFPHPPTEALCTTYPLGAVSFQGIKRRGRDVDHPPTSSGEIQRTEDVYTCSPSGIRGLSYGEIYLLSRTYYLFIQPSSMLFRVWTALDVEERWTCLLGG
jgi:hypothetical protein